MRLNSEYHGYIYYSGLILIAVFLPWSRFLLSVSVFVLVGNWLWEGSYGYKLNNFLKCKPAWLLVGFWLLHVIGILYSEDFDYALDDIRVKLPLLALPVIISSSAPLPKKHLERLVRLFILSVLLATLFAALVYAGITGKAMYDVREISIFISHIRLSLLICLATLFLIYLLANEQKLLHRAIELTVIIWLLFFLVLMESFTGLIIFFITGIFLAGKHTISIKNTFKKTLTFIFLLLLITVPCRYIYMQVNDFYTIEKVMAEQLPIRTARGDYYHHDLTNKQVENGRYVWLNMAWGELELTWNQRSSIDFRGLDKTGQPIYSTLARFITSKGLRKDQDAVLGLSNKEIEAVENGVANVNFMNGDNIKTRIYETIWEFHNYLIGGSPERNTVTQRLEFWKTGRNVFWEAPLFGHGTGDVLVQMKKEYQETGSKLSEGYWLKPHNQYLTTGVALGSIGCACLLLILLVSLRAPSYHVISIVLVSGLSMLTEDTLETQIGVTLFTFFYCLFLFGSKAE